MISGIKRVSDASCPCINLNRPNIVKILKPMPKKNVLWISLLCGFILLLSGLGGGYLIFTRVYLPDKMSADANATLMLRWEKEDTFQPPADGIIRPDIFSLFLKVNDAMAGYLQNIKRQFEQNSWQIAFEMIKMQPRWAGIKYRALKENNLSPKEYEWISNCVIDFWIYRWKEESLEKLRQFGWEFEGTPQIDRFPVNYDLLLAHEAELNQIFDILWPEKPSTSEIPVDSTVVSRSE